MKQFFNLSIYLGRPSGRPAQATTFFHCFLSSISVPSSRVLSRPESSSNLSMNVVFCWPLLLVPSRGSHRTMLLVVSSLWRLQVSSSHLYCCQVSLLPRIDLLGQGVAVSCHPHRSRRWNLWLQSSTTSVCHSSPGRDEAIFFIQGAWVVVP